MTPSAGEKFFGAYGATKAAQIALVKSWQAEMHQHGHQSLDPVAKPDANRHPRPVLPRRRP